MFNKVILVGNLTRDIELRYSQSGMAIAKTGIATNRKFTSNGEKKEEVMFIDITFFARSAEIANQYLRKGSKILVEGRLQLDQWVDQNGGKRSKHGVVVETMQMLDSRADSQMGAGAGTSSGGYNAPQSQSGYNAPQSSYSAPQGGYNAPKQQDTYKQPQQQAPESTIPEINIDEDEIPF